MMGRYHLRCKNRFLYYYVSVSLLRVGDKFRFTIEFTIFFNFLFILYCP
jgi:hypothetical protein